MRPDRLRPTHPIADYVATLEADATRAPEARAFMLAQARRLLVEFEGATAAEWNRLRCALECLEVGRDRSQGWETRGVALDKAARILQGLGVIERRRRGATVAPTRRRRARSLFTPPARSGSPLGEAGPDDEGDDYAPGSTIADVDEVGPEGGADCPEGADGDHDKAV